jgi:hypothetical protein
LAPGSGIGIRDGKKSRSGMNIPELIFDNSVSVFGVKNNRYLNSLMRIRDPGWRQFGSGIRDGKKSDPG